MEFLCTDALNFNNPAAVEVAEGLRRLLDSASR
jgi:hypothetical protein